MTLVSYGENHARNSNLKWDYLLGYGQDTVDGQPACVNAVKAAGLEKDTNLSEVSAEATARIACLKAANGKD